MIYERHVRLRHVRQTDGVIDHVQAFFRKKHSRRELCRHGGKVKGQECSGSRKKVDPSGAGAASPLGAAPDPKPRLPTRPTAASKHSRRELCRHGGKVKGQECSGSRKKVDPSGAGAASPLGAAPDPKPRLPTRPTAASVSSDPLFLDYSGVFDKLTAVLKCVPVYDHIPKPCRKTDGWKPVLGCSLVCLPEGLAESSPATFDRLCSFHPKIPVDRRVFLALTPTAGCVSPAEVLRAVKSFKIGSSGGLDGLPPQHLKDVFLGPLPIDDTLNFLIQFINLILSGACPLSLSELKFALGRVSCLLAHAALTIIRNALSLLKLMYFLRTSKHIDPSKLGEFDGALRTTLSSICNVQAPGRMHTNTLESRQMFGVGCYGPWHPRRTIRKPDK
ncbi:hypothetical protein HELRODRAFT_165170 [Helobdella robusta]|uniref:Uncharacterized protein n=1 Tax=Helobdella robusta TaxID=6412 RepID=T1EWD3_HELRO|nr:hypothetical protein HELRODRAFT_165170 [Helobdella robusta]ESN93015.1 hypothetical protein HELRODRAFT_165170 [Helobdella robusta]